MALEWDLDTSNGSVGTWNVFFMALSLLMATIGSYTAIQFIETLMAVENDSQSHTSKKGSAGFSVFAASWCIAINCVWVMHFLAMSAVQHGDKPVRYSLLVTLLSMVYIFIGAFAALSVITFHKKSIVYTARERQATHAQQRVAALTGVACGANADLTSTLDALRHELTVLLSDAWAFASLRLLTASVLLGTGVGLMHFTGMDAMRLEGTTMTLHPAMAAVTFPLGWVGSSAILFFLYHMHGFKRRVAAAIVIGVAVNLVHYFGYFAGTFRPDPRPTEPKATGELLVDAEVACVVVSLLSSVARFIFMGSIAAAS